MLPRLDVATVTGCGNVVVAALPGCVAGVVDIGGALVDAVGVAGGGVVADARQPLLLPLKKNPGRHVKLKDVHCALMGQGVHWSFEITDLKFVPPHCTHPEPVTFSPYPI